VLDAFPRPGSRVFFTLHLISLTVMTALYLFTYPNVDFYLLNTERHTEDDIIMGFCAEHFEPNAASSESSWEMVPTSYLEK
jgi:hypothetical protein